MDYGSTVDSAARGPDLPVAPQRADIHLTLTARADQVAMARHVVGAMAEALSVPTSVVEDIRLAVTEAFTNVVRHAYENGGGRVDIDVAPHRDGLTIVVTDAGSGIQHNPDGGPGLGLPLITAVTEAFEIVQPASGGSALHMSFRTCTGRFHRTL